MNVGDYIRIDGYISKIGHLKTSSSDETYVQWKQPSGLLASGNIKLIEKSSPRIIDLIEVGDYVNGCPVYCINYDLDKEEDVVESVTIIIPFQEDKDILYAEDIKSIVTHEQFEAMKYKVGD